MHTNILSSLFAAVMISGTLIGGAQADPNDFIPDLSGDEPLSIRQMQIANERALRAARGLSVNRHENGAATGTYADFPDQAYGDLSGDVPVSVRLQQATNSAAFGNKAKALRAKPGLNETRYQNSAVTGAFADYPDQAYGDLSGDVPVSVRRQRADNAAALGFAAE